MSAICLSHDSDSDTIYPRFVEQIHNAKKLFLILEVAIYIGRLSNKGGANVISHQLRDHRGEVKSGIFRKKPLCVLNALKPTHYCSRVRRKVQLGKVFTSSLRTLQPACVDFERKEGSVCIQ